MSKRRKLQAPTVQERKSHLGNLQNNTAVASNGGIQPSTLNPQSEILGRLNGTDQTVLQAVAKHTKFSGPIPHPDIMRAYGEILHDAPERIIRVFEADSAHERDIVSKALDCEFKENSRLHWMGFALIVSILAMGAFFGYLGNTVLATTLFVTTVGVVAAGFIERRLGKKGGQGNSQSVENKKSINK